MAAAATRREEEGEEGARRRSVGRWRGDEKALRQIMVGLVGQGRVNDAERAGGLVVR